MAVSLVRAPEPEVLGTLVVSVLSCMRSLRPRSSEHGAVPEEQGQVVPTQESLVPVGLEVVVPAESDTVVVPAKRTRLLGLEEERLPLIGPGPGGLGSELASATSVPSSE